MATGDSIPIVDFEVVFSRDDLSTCPQVQQLHQAFTEVGFVFIKNHGIDQMLIDRVFSASRDFFHQPLEVKQQYTLKVEGENCGYIAVGQECAASDTSRPADLKECFDLSENTMFPEDDPPNFKPLLHDLYKSGIGLGHTVLELMGHALQLEDPRYFVKAHSKAGQPGNFTFSRSLYYPPLPPGLAVEPGQLRCGEHVDYGSITLLFQDPNGGLQVKRRDGGYIAVPCIPDAILLNLGRIMESWTSDMYLATPHRVLVPEDELRRSRARQSITVSIHPDHDTKVQCVLGKNKYPPYTAYEETKRRYSSTVKF